MSEATVVPPRPPLDVRVFQWLVAFAVMGTWAFVPLRGYETYLRWDALRDARARFESCRSNANPACVAAASADILAREPTDTDALVGRCLAYGELAAHDAVESSCPPAIRALTAQHGPHATLLQMEALRATALSQRGDTRGALDAVARILALPGADRTRWLTRRGQLLERTGAQADALAAYREASAAQTSNADEADQRQADMLLAAERSTEALDALGRLIARSPGRAVERRQRALILVRLGRQREALEDLGWLASNGHGDDTVLLHLGDAHLAESHAYEALDAYRRLVQIIPGSPSGVIGVFHASALTGDRHVRQLMRGLPNDTDQPEVALRLGRAYGALCTAQPRRCNRDVRTRARVMLERFLERAPNDPRAGSVRQELDAAPARR